MLSVETFGASLPGLLLEAVVDPNDPERCVLHTWNGHRAATVPKVEHAGVSYVPKQPENGLAQSVRFPPPSLPFGSTGKLTSTLREYLATYSQVTPEATVVLVAFGLASWFCDLFTLAPVLYVFGSASAVSQVLRLLACFCRRPLLLADIDSGGLAALPSGLRATLLVNERNLRRRVQRILLASTRPDFCIIRGKQRLDIHGARAFAFDYIPESELGLVISLPPAQAPLPTLSHEQEERIAHDLQAQLLRYRMLHFEKVRRARIDTSAFVPEIREEASAWLAPIVDCSELSESVRAEILRQSQDAAGARFIDPRCIVVEAALFYCHRPNTTDFLVGELAVRVNDLRRARHEESKLSAKMVGKLLRELGIHGKRKTHGYRIDLCDQVRKHIHQLAVDYCVPALDDGVRWCPDCGEGAASAAVNEHMHV